MNELKQQMTAWAKAQGYGTLDIEIEDNANYAPLRIGKKLVVGDLWAARKFDPRPWDRYWPV